MALAKAMGLTSQLPKMIPLKSIQGKVTDHDVAIDSKIKLFYL